MSNAAMDGLVAAYQDLDTARRDFDAVVQLVRNKSVTVEGVIIVSQDEDGNVTVVDTGDRVGRTGIRPRNEIDHRH